MASIEPAKRIWTILELITWGTGYLTEKGFDESRLTIELLLAHVLNLRRIQLYTKFDQPLREEELAAFKALLKRRLTNEPLQYITGSAEFMGLPFIVDRSVLIPRPETELLVDHAVHSLKRTFGANEPLTILDLGTGSGCIAVAMASKLPAAQVTAVDISPDAIATATINAERNGVADRIAFLTADMMSLNAEAFPSKFHCILSNPPYISTKEFAEVSADVRDYEPNIALTDNGNGLKFYPLLAHLASQLLQPGGIVGVEHAFDQSAAVRSLFTAAGFGEGEVVRDLAGIERHLFCSKQ